MTKLILSTLLHPKKEIVAVCDACKKEVKRVAYDGFFDHDKKEAAMRKIRVCPHCKASFKEDAKAVKIEWKKTVEGDLKAEATNGDFLVWRYGIGYKWRYRKYGGAYADEVGFTNTKKAAQKACEKHKEWR